MSCFNSIGNRLRELSSDEFQTVSSRECYCTVTVTVCEPHDDEKVTLPFCFFTLIVKLTGLVPVTVAEAGET